jgi:hypothetical protein
VNTSKYRRQWAVAGRPTTSSSAQSWLSPQVAARRLIRRLEISTDVVTNVEMSDEESGKFGD